MSRRVLDPLQPFYDARKRVGVDGEGLLERYPRGTPPRVLRTVRRCSALRGQTKLDLAPPCGAAFPAVHAMLRQANGNREARVVSLQRLLALAVHGHRSFGPGPFVLWHDAAEGRGWGYHDARTTVCLVVGDGGRYLYLGARECPAQKASPGRAWRSLQPWSDKDPVKNAGRVDAWCADWRENGLVRVDVRHLLH
jgi:hypothetical protein